MKSKIGKFNLFDALISSKLNSSTSSTSTDKSILPNTTGSIILNTKHSNTLHSNAARWNEVLTPKTFVYKKKKKKKISTLKKKILMVIYDYI